MFRFFENLVNPYCDYPETDTPPTKLWPFMRDYAQPFKSVFCAAGVMSIIVAAIEIGLISYMGSSQGHQKNSGAITALS